MEEKILKALQEKGAMRPGDIAAAAGVEILAFDSIVQPEEVVLDAPVKILL